MMLSKLISRAPSFVKSSYFHLAVTRPALRAARQSARGLRAVQNHTGSIRKDNVVLISTLRNEMPRLPFFLDYYRSLGVGHFIFIDNDSSDGFQDYVSVMKDVSVWHTPDSYRESHYGIDWVNHLLNEYGSGHWCVTVDPDELLVYPQSENRSVKELTAYLSAHDLQHLPCVLIDMYAASGMSRAPSVEGVDPRTVCPFFDASGYRFQESDFWLGTHVQGGVRERIFFRANPHESPTLNKTPLVLWDKRYVYLSSTHVLSPRRLNEWHSGGAQRVTGALLHFKFVQSLASKISEEMTRRQHYAAGAEYEAYGDQMHRDEDWISDRSRRYESSHSLVESGLMFAGDWPDGELNRSASIARSDSSHDAR